MLHEQKPKPGRPQGEKDSENPGWRRLARALCPNASTQRLSPGLWLFGALGLSALGMAFANGDVSLLLAGPLLMLMAVTCQCYTSTGGRKS
ncbi:MAG: hypothetical protein EHM62_03655 [Methylococcus sp.]|nr:MAG: hypothetical protein EHM62_03655 [Methylococcus sp.]